MTSEIEERRRKQTIKVAITEICMLVTIIILVIFLVMLALGYNFRLGGEVETSGLVQINSVPSGAAIAVDGEGMFLPTNQSKTMTSGEHLIELRRDGYTAWSKTIKVREGMLYRLYYPRMYLEKRERKVIASKSEEQVVDGVSSGGLVGVYFSKDRKYLLHIYNGKTTWGLWGLNDGEPKMKEIEVGTVVPAEARVEVLDWAKNSSKVLVKSCLETCDLALVNLNEPAKSLNLTKVFALNFSEVKIASDSADMLLGLADGNLRQINVTDVEISKVLAEGVESFTNYGPKVAYVKAGEIYLYSDEKPIKLYATEDGAPLMALLSEYYGEDYLTVVSGGEMRVYYGKLPNRDEKFSKTMHELATMTLSFMPEKVEVHGGGELVVASHGEKVAVMDAESYEIMEYVAETEPRWLSDFDIYTAKDGWLTARDFDNSNPRALIAEFDEGLPVGISENDKYIYYYIDGSLVRETIR